MAESTTARAAPDLPAGPHDERQAWWRRPVVAGVLLLVAYVALSFLMSPRGYLGTDTGGKVATLEVMAHHGGGFDPNVGYWAAKWDPKATLHGLYYTYRVGDRYLNVTTLPMIYVALPLYELGGYRLALLIPMLGAVACAYAARALARRVGPGDGWLAFWIVGLASPVTIYALDLWEHTLGLACMAWGAIVLVDAAQRGATWKRGLLAGALFGVAASMRTEALAYAFVGTAIVCVLLLARERSVRSPLIVGASAAVGLAALVAANAALETAALGSTIRAARATGAAQSASGALGTRVDEAITMSGGLLGSTAHSGYVVIVGLIAMLAFVAYRAARPRDDQRPAQLVAAVVCVLYLARLAEGTGFVPGLVATTPFAAAGLALAWKDGVARVAALIALVSLPVVWLTDFTGGVLPQWGGRYILTSGLLLGAVGVARMQGAARWGRAVFVALAVGVTAFGVVWMSQRTHEVADAGAWIAARPEPVVVSDVQFWLRESGSYEPDRRWLTTDKAGDLDRAAGIVTDAGFDRFGLITLDAPGKASPTVDGYRAVSHQVKDWLGVPFRYTIYERDGG
jgi:hypothetical protein